MANLDTGFWFGGECKVSSRENNNVFRLAGLIKRDLKITLPKARFYIHVRTWSTGQSIKVHLMKLDQEVRSDKELNEGFGYIEINPDRIDDDPRLNFDGKNVAYIIKRVLENHNRRYKGGQAGAEKVKFMYSIAIGKPGLPFNHKKIGKKRAGSV